jgi:hypothetical protein
MPGAGVARDQRQPLEALEKSFFKKGLGHRGVLPF